MEFNELMEQFAVRFGIADLSIEDNAVALEIDGMAFGFLVNSAADTLTVVADLGQQPVDADGPFGAMMLQANFLFEATKGATLFQNPDSKSFGLQQQYRLVYLDVDTLAAEVEKLANVAEDWKDIISGCKAAETAVDARTEEEAEFPTTGLLQV